MPNKDAHIAAATNNEDLARKLLADSQIDWAIVLTFYAALHWVEAALAASSLPVHLKSHEARDNMLADNRALSPIASNYQYLRERADKARYELKRYTAKQAEQLLDQELAIIENHIEGMLNR